MPNASVCSTLSQPTCPVLLCFSCRQGFCCALPSSATNCWFAACPAARLDVITATSSPGRAAGESLATVSPRPHLKLWGEAQSSVWHLSVRGPALGAPPRPRPRPGRTRKPGPASRPPSSRVGPAPRPRASQLPARGKPPLLQHLPLQPARRRHGKPRLPAPCLAGAAWARPAMRLETRGRPAAVAAV